MERRMTYCTGSGRRVGLSPGQQRHTGGAVRPNQATNVRCPDCGRTFPTTRIVHTDHGIPTDPAALIPRHKDNIMNDREAAIRDEMERADDMARGLGGMLGPDDLRYYGEQLAYASLPTEAETRRYFEQEAEEMRRLYAPMEAAQDHLATLGAAVILGGPLTSAWVDWDFDLTPEQDDVSVFTFDFGHIKDVMAAAMAPFS
jgi:hypothetical protein